MHSVAISFWRSSGRYFRVRMLSSLSASFTRITRISLVKAKSIFRIVSAACTVLFFALTDDSLLTPATITAVWGPNRSSIKGSGAARRELNAFELFFFNACSPLVVCFTPLGEIRDSSNADFSLFAGFPSIFLSKFASWTKPDIRSSIVSWRRPARIESRSIPRSRRISATLIS